MGSNGRGTDPSIAEALFERGYEFEFFQAVRLLARLLPHRKAVGGTAKPGDGSDLDPLKCQLARPHGIFVDADGSIFIGDTEAHRVRLIRSVK